MLLLEIVEKCGYLPLAIRMLGKAVKSFSDIIPSDFTVNKFFKHVMMGWNKCGIKKLDDTARPSVNVSLYDTLDRTFSMVVTSTESSNFIKMCFGALAVTFTLDNCMHPWTSSSIVELLWTELMKYENEDNREVLNKDGLCGGSDVCSILATSGPVDLMELDGSHNTKTRHIRISHDLLWECGKHYLEKNLHLEVSNKKDKSCFFDLAVDENVEVCGKYRMQINSYYDIFEQKD